MKGPKVEQRKSWVNNQHRTQFKLTHMCYYIYYVQQQMPAIDACQNCKFHRKAHLILVIAYIMSSTFQRQMLSQTHFKLIIVAQSFIQTSCKVAGKVYATRSRKEVRWTIFCV
ncbi:Hypothetical_protein [Hexamita inflata]|uniref:Hypothetical_protein n=1 Tax=Hexamita inflata TaxID=28002 RepID=A0AA86PV89_9EUKA|nr:Hypothetical protein HINF_LOCUS32442 [Hexamita inflata]